MFVVVVWVVTKYCCFVWLDDDGYDEFLLKKVCFDVWELENSVLEVKVVQKWWLIYRLHVVDEFELKSWHLMI